MAKKSYEVAFMLAAKMNGQFSKAFNSAGKVVESLGDRLERMKSESGNIASLVRARKAVAESSKQYAQASQRVALLGKALSETSAPTQKQIAEFNQAKAALAKTKSSLEKNRSALRDLNKQMDAGNLSLQALVDRQKDLARATDLATKAQKKQAEIQERMDKVKSAEEKISGANLGRAAGLAAGGAAMAAGGAMLKMGSEYQSAMNRLQASTGMSNDEIKKLEASARSIYTSGIGESFTEVTAAMATMRQVSGLTGKALEEAAKNAMVLGSQFDMDVGESARASAALMKNFGISGKEAYDLIAFAAQNGANKNGDLLDTFNEYAVHYKSMGFSAQEFAAHLIQGAKDGAFSIDKVGDAIKEFNIRSKDGSQTSLDAFAELGLSGEHATKMFAAGGERAQLAFAEVVKRLNAIEDPVKRNRIGVSLFGTQFEDLESGALKTFASIKGASLEAAGTMDEINKLQGRDIGSQIRIIARQFQDTLAPAAQSAADGLLAHMPEIQKAIQATSPFVERLGQAFAENLPAIAQSLTGVMQSVASFAGFLLKNFDAISSAAIFLAKAFIGLQAIQLAAGPMLKIYRTGLMLQKMYVGLRANTVLMATVSRIAAGAMKGLAVATKMLGAAFKFLMANPIVLVFAGLVAAGVALYKNWDKLKEMAGIAANFIAEKWHAALDSIKGFFSQTFNSLAAIMKTPINAIIGLINGVINSLNSLSISVPDWVPGLGGKTLGMNIPQIPQLADGGIATKPTLAAIGEGGEPEAVLPLSKLSSLAGSGGTQGTGLGSGVSINFSPVINVSGGGSSGDDVSRALELSEQRLKAMIKRIMADQQRVSFA